MYINLSSVKPMSCVDSDCCFADEAVESRDCDGETFWCRKLKSWRSKASQSSTTNYKVGLYYSSHYLCLHIQINYII